MEKEQNTNNEVYLRISDDCFYKIKDNDCISISLSRKKMQKNVCLPSAYMHQVFVSSKEEFEKAKKKIGF